VNLLTILNIAVGLILIYSVLSLVASHVQELLATFLNWREKHLRQVITNILGEDSSESRLIHNFFKHSLIQSLNHSDTTNKTSVAISYIPKDKFANILLEMVKEFEPKSCYTINELEEIVEKAELPEGLKKNLYLFAKQAKSKAEDANQQLEYLQQEIEKWFDSAMNSASAIYKKKAKIAGIMIALAIALMFNVDTIYIIHCLYQDQTLSSTINPIAEQIVSSHTQEFSCLQDTINEAAKSNCLTAVMDDVNSIFFDNFFDFPIGWNLSDPFGKQFTPLNLQNVIKVITGWSLTAFAITMGAPFWFDLLRQIINVSKEGKKV
jgi:hypothetical protein